MTFKPAKCRSLVQRKGRVEGKDCFHLDGLPIPLVSEKPVKSLGNIFDSTLTDTAAIQQLKTWLSPLDLPGKFKAWIYQQGILPRLLWPLLMYQVQITIVEGFERNISQFLHRWLDLLKSLSCIALYGYTNKLQPPFSGLTEEFKFKRAGRCFFTETHLTPESPLQALWSELEGSDGHRRPSSRQKRGCNMVSWWAQWQSDGRGFLATQQHAKTEPRGERDGS